MKTYEPPDSHSGVVRLYLLELFRYPCMHRGSAQGRKAYEDEE